MFLYRKLQSENSSRFDSQFGCKYDLGPRCKSYRSVMEAAERKVRGGERHEAFRRVAEGAILGHARADDAYSLAMREQKEKAGLETFCAAHNVMEDMDVFAVAVATADRDE